MNGQNGCEGGGTRPEGVALVVLDGLAFGLTPVGPRFSRMNAYSLGRNRG